MDPHLSDIKDLVTIFKPFIDPVIETIIRPQIKKLGKLIKREELKNILVDNFFENKFEEYLARTYDNAQNINILIFQNQQIKLKEIYYPLTIFKGYAENRVSYHLDDFKLDYIEPFKKMLISDTAGMGKSTISKFITLKTIENNLAIPVLIELRNLKEGHSVLDEIFLQFNPIDQDFDKDLILKFLELGKFFFLFDGFDEIQLKGREVIIKELHSFIKKTSNNLFLITSRQEGALASFGDFQLFNIAALTEKESFGLIRKYDAKSPEKVGEKLIHDIQLNFNQTKELLRNPFLVSLIYSTYTYNKDIPSNKATFYEEIYSALFKRHDLSKDGWIRPKTSKLDIQQFKTILRQLAFDTAVVGTIVYSESEILQFIKEAKAKCPGLEFKESDYLSDILSPVPLFQKDGSKIKWAHKSLQDYFAADFIAFHSKKEEILTRIYNSEKESFANILDLFFELDYKTIRKTIIKFILIKFIDFCENAYQQLDGIPEKWIEERKARQFGCTTYIFNSRASSVGYTISYLKGFVPDLLDDRRKPHGFGIDDVFILTLSNFDAQIINMLANKKLHFLTNKYKPYQTELKTWQLKKFECIEVNDNPRSMLNDKINFQKVNIVLSITNPFQHFLDYKSSAKELKVIMADIEKEKIADTFSDI